ncbi:uncharacterized protein LOC116244914 [Nymphaea colorata]|uniref:uncharacterized protein LOC116244914 n=1 Tax=Nymphaea colorata TaxID=210225 RepID=UPI00129DDC40|nr:uncharacterized protein LOC116244914 [Nymphaea colorata]
MAEDRYVFIVEWFDSAASLVRTYNLTYFLKDKSIEMGHRGKPYYNELTSHATSDLVVAVEVLAENCINKIRDFTGSIRSQFGQDQVRSAIYGSESAAGAAKEIELFFSAKSPLQAPAYFTNCSCLVIKPHLITEGYVGQIFDALLTAGFESALPKCSGSTVPPQR